MAKQMIVSSESRGSVSYEVEIVKDVKFGLARDLYSASDIVGNEMNPDDLIFIIFFHSGERATFSNDFSISFSK